MVKITFVFLYVCLTDHVCVCVFVFVCVFVRVRVRVRVRVSVRVLRLMDESRQSMDHVCVQWISPDSRWSTCVPDGRVVMVVTSCHDRRPPMVWVVLIKMEENIAYDIVI